MKKALLFFSFLLYLALNPITLNAEKFAVVIDDFVRVLDEDSNGCEFNNWGKKLKNTCVCCILKQARTVLTNKVSAKSTIKGCINNGKCQEATLEELSKDILKQLKKNPQSEEDIYKNFIGDLFRKRAFPKFTSTEGINLNGKGNFTPESAAKFLERTHKERWLRGNQFKQADCLKVRDMIEEKKDAPWATEQLFFVTSTCSPQKTETFIFKEMKPSKDEEDPVQEIYRLLRATRYPPLGPLIYPSNVKNYPQLILPIAYLAYIHKDTKHQLSLMNVASGNQLMKLIKDFKKKSYDKGTINQVARAYFDLGVALANFYKKYMEPIKEGKLGKTITQGDLHQGNIFYDPNTRQVTFIDNERIVYSLDQLQDIQEDLAFLLMKSLFVLAWLDGKFLDNFPFQRWYSVFLPNFIAGFLSTYPSDEILSIYNQLVDRIVNHKWYTDKEIIKGFSHKAYMDPVFKDLGTSDLLFYLGNDISRNVKDEGGKTPLHYAAAKNALMIHPLVQAGADVNARDLHNNTPLHEAAYFNNAAAIKSLVDAGADINAQDRDKNTPLHKAIYNNSKEAIQELISLGANVKMKNNKGESPEQFLP
jgi:hypothetical protein